MCNQVCDIYSHCIYGGLANNFNVVAAYTDGNLCAAYGECTGCSAQRLGGSIVDRTGPVISDGGEIIRYKASVAPSRQSVDSSES